jgi:isoleucyl-tRNA synthetase
VPKRYDPDAIREVVARFFDTLRNTYAFFAQYASLEGWRPGASAPPPQARPELDRWILSRLDGLAAACGREMEAYELTHAARRIADFVVEDLSNWYVRRSRPRFWGTRGADRADMRAAFATLEECLVTVSRLLAPFAPFVSDWVHRALTGGWSAHLAAYPVSRGREDPALERGMDAVRRLANLGHAVRDRLRIRVRQPLRRMTVVVPEEVRPVWTEALARILADELNVKRVERADEVAELVRVRAAPNFRVLGPAFGPLAPKVAEAIRGLDAKTLGRWRRAGGPLVVEVDGRAVEVDPAAVQVHEEAAPGWAVRAEAGYAVALDPALDDALRREGTARELVNRIQRLRRDAGLRVEDRIRLGIFGPREVAEAAAAHRDYIAAETLAVEVTIGGELPRERYATCREVQLDGTRAAIALESVRGRPGRGRGARMSGGGAVDRAERTRRPIRR